jgi:hypothetical protein
MRRAGIVHDLVDHLQAARNHRTSVTVVDATVATARENATPQLVRELVP